MSQRLHVGKTKESFYVCVIEDESDVYNKLLSEFFCKHNGVFLGPWKIRIGDINLFKKIEFLLSKAFDSVGKKYPDDVWVFYQEDKYLVHPTKKELAKWINVQNEISKGNK